jgi:protein-disulfide isomerase
MAQTNDPPRTPWTAAIWPLVTGLAVGFLVGRETSSHGTGGASTEAAAESGAKGSDDSKAPAGTKMPAKLYKSESEFPDGWTKSADLASVTGVSFDGLSPAQKVTVMQALNERDCECGCGMGKIAGCLKKDPNCPRSPNLAKLAIDMGKQGKGMGEILAAIDEKQKPAAPSGGGSAPEAGGSRKVVPFAHDLRRGAKATKVTIVEFSDFQCPFCKRAEPTVKGLLDKYGKDVALVWMNQPLPFHDHAMDAATAFQAAGRQGADKAWKLHDKMYENNTALTRADIEKYAGDVGLNVAKLKKDWDDPKIKDEVAQDQKIATAVGASGTPTFFINGQQIVGAQESSAFEKIIDDELKKADELMKKGTPLKDVYGKRIEAAANAPAPAAPSGGGGDDPNKKFDIHVGDAPVKGPASAPVTVVAWSDFQCPFCGRAAPTMKQIEDAYKGKVRIAFKQYPLPFHDKAHLAAEAALAANEQGKFWQMHDKLFANQQALDRASLEKYAEELGLDMAKFKAALDSGKFKDKVDAEDKEGAGVGVTGTPTFFINGTRLVGAQPFDAFKNVIDKELAKKG